MNAYAQITANMRNCSKIAVHRFAHVELRKINRARFRHVEILSPTSQNRQNENGQRIRLAPAGEVFVLNHQPLKRRFEHHVEGRFGDAFELREAGAVDDDVANRCFASLSPEGGAGLLGERCRHADHR